MAPVQVRRPSAPQPAAAATPQSNASCLPRRVIIITTMASRAGVPRITVSSTISSKYAATPRTMIPNMTPMPGLASWKPITPMITTISATRSKVPRLGAVPHSPALNEATHSRKGIGAANGSVSTVYESRSGYRVRPLGVRLDGLRVAAARDGHVGRAVQAGRRVRRPCELYDHVLAVAGMAERDVRPRSGAPGATFCRGNPCVPTGLSFLVPPFRLVPV